MLLRLPSRLPLTYHPHLKNLEQAFHTYIVHANAQIQTSRRRLALIDHIAKTSKHSHFHGVELQGNIKKMIGVPLKQTGAVEAVLVQ